MPEPRRSFRQAFRSAFKVGQRPEGTRAPQVIAINTQPARQQLRRLEELMERDVDHHEDNNATIRTYGYVLNRAAITREQLEELERKIEESRRTVEERIRAREEGHE